MNRLMLAMLVATLSLPVTAATTVKSSKSNSSYRDLAPATEAAAATDLNASTSSVERGKPTKEQILDREHALSGADSCNFTIDEKGVKRQASERQRKECKTASESRSNNSRAGNPSPGNPGSGGAGVATSDPGVPGNGSMMKK